MAWAGLDQRVFPRLSRPCDISIREPAGKTIQTKTQNLGAGGACVILNQKIEKLSRVSLRIVLEESVPPLECEGRVVWMVRSKEPASGTVTFDVGIEFIDLPAENQERLVSFIERRRKLV